MATTTSYQPTPSQWASAAMHLDRRSDWRYFRVDGVRYVALPSGRSEHVYRLPVDGTTCDCEWSKRGYPLCSHKLAMELAATEDDLRAAPALLSDAECELLFTIAFSGAF